MAKLKRFSAICLALVLVFSSVSVGLAEGPKGNHTGSDPTDGGDGHPWDDGTVEETQPSEDGGETLDDVESGTYNAMPVVVMRGGFSGWFQGALTMVWHKIVDTEISSKVSYKPGPRRGSRRVF